MRESHRLILIVEDHSGHGKIAKRAFDYSETLCIAHVVSTLAEAREFIDQREPDVVIADLIVPDGCGTDLLPNGADEAMFPVIILTNEADDRVAVDVMKRGAFDYVVKTGHSLLDLPRVACRVHREWQLQQEKREAERQVRENERLLQGILDSIPDLLLVLDRTGEILECRGGRARSTDDCASTLKGRNLYDFVNPQVFEELLDKFKSSLSSSTPETAECEVNFETGGYQAELRIVAYDCDRLLAVIRDVSARKTAESKLNALSDREREVLTAIAAGKPNKTIAYELNISIKTVEVHRARLMKKIQADNMADLMRVAVQIEDLESNG